MTKETKILSNRNDLIETAAKIISDKLLSLSSGSDDYHIAITGGTVGTLTLGALGELTKGIDLSKLHIWWIDERYVSRESSERNDIQARKAWLSESSVLEQNIHPFPSIESGPIENAADFFANQIDTWKPQFELLLLGMGEDGHVASLFPGSLGIATGDFVVVEKSSPKAPAERLSLSMKAINSAKEIMFLVSGKDKARAVSDVISGVGSLPAESVAGSEKTLWLLDEDAASMITSS
jgi:6-phosphogluconolactonase